MRNVSIDDFEDLPVAVLPIGRDYPPDSALAEHRHRRAQLLYGASGVMTVDTTDGSFTVPTDRAVLIPPGTPHEVHFLDVSTWSLYIEPIAVPWWPGTCEVIDVSPLLRELLRAANELPLDYDVAGRDGVLLQLALHEVQRQSPLPLTVRLPADEPLRSLCLAYLEQPDVAVNNTAWARQVAMSSRTLDRRFRDAVGASPASWRMRARLLGGVRALRTQTVTEVAAQLGYSSPASFTTAFRQTFGVPPSRFR